MILDFSEINHVLKSKIFKGKRFSLCNKLQSCHCCCLKNESFMMEDFERLKEIVKNCVNRNEIFYI